MKNSVFLLLTTSVFLTLLAATFFLLPKPQPAQAGTLPAPALQPSAHILEEPIQPIPEEVDLDAAKVTLGGQLFQDKRLSHDDTLSCAGCHALGKGGTDQLAHSVGVGGVIGVVNAPTVFNSGLNYRQFWNGRADTLEDQVNGPTHNPEEMRSDWDEIMGKLRRDVKYRAAFAALYPDGIHPRNVRDAISTYERSLITPDSRFDRYLRGDRAALSVSEKRGYLLFKQDGCVSCHQGANIGGNMFQKFGVMGDYFAARGHETDADSGRYAVTGRVSDKHVFRVPSLRNVALTAPYFHDGSATTLPQAVEVMAIYQLGRPLEPNELVQIVEFLNSTTGTQPGRPGRPGSSEQPGGPK